MPKPSPHLEAACAELGEAQLLLLAPKKRRDIRRLRLREEEREEAGPAPPHTPGSRLGRGHPNASGLVRQALHLPLTEIRLEACHQESTTGHSKSAPLQTPKPENPFRSNQAVELWGDIWGGLKWLYKGVPDLLRHLLLQFLLASDSFSGWRLLLTCS